jgi:NAD(P)-dependent dehydrogenase (short-subunit alcohol dehydrogenase family)
MMDEPIYTFDLTNKVVAITGGYGHLGAAITRSLQYHNANVFVLGRNEEKFVKRFPQVLNNLAFIKCDIADSASIRDAFSAIINTAGKIDVLINNAVYSKGQSPETMTDEQWGFGIDGTLNSVFRCTREVIPYLKRSRGKIINVSSMYGMVAPDFQIYDESPEFLNPPHYGSAKAAVIQLTKYYASYLGKDGITVNAVTPGPFPSPVVQKSKKFVEALGNKTMLNRIGNPEDLAGAFVFLSSDASNYITGQNIVIDGGWTAK